MDYTKNKIAISTYKYKVHVDESHMKSYGWRNNQIFTKSVHTEDEWKKFVEEEKSLGADTELLEVTTKYITPRFKVGDDVYAFFGLWEHGGCALMKVTEVVVDPFGKVAYHCNDALGKNECYWYDTKFSDDRKFDDGRGQWILYATREEMAKDVAEIALFGACFDVREQVDYVGM